VVFFVGEIITKEKQHYEHPPNVVLMEQEPGVE